MRSKKLIKYIIMGFIIVMMVDTMPPKGIGDDTVLFLNPVTSAPPPAVTFFLDNSASMYDLPCAVPDCDQSCGLNGVTTSNFFINMGYGVAGSAPNYNSSSYPHYLVFDPCAGGSSCSSTYNTGTSGFDGIYSPNYVYYENGCGSWGRGNLISSYSASIQSNIKKYGYYYSGGNYYMSGDLLNFYPPKFVVLRKVVSDIITYNAKTLLPQKQQVRVAIMDFANSSNANLSVGMSPSCSSIGSTAVTDYNLTGNSNKFYNAIYGTSNGNYTHDLGTNTPLAQALIQLGAYYVQNNTRYQTDACNNTGASACTSYNVIGGGTPPDPWCGSSNTNYYCEQMYDIVITDGNENSASNSITTWNISNYYQALNSQSGDNDTICNGAPGGVCHIDEVAGWLHSYNIRNIQCSTALDTYTVGFYGQTTPVSCTSVYSDWQTNDNDKYCRTPSSSTTPCDQSPFWHYDSTNKQVYCQLPFDVLKKAANMGGGLFASGTNYQQLETALIKAIGSIIQKDRIYGSPTLPQLISAGAGSTTTTIFKAYVASFLPKDQNFWIGHLREYTGASDISTGTISLYDKTGALFSGYTGNGTQCSFSGIVPPPIWDAEADFTDTTLPACSSTPGNKAPPCHLATNLRNIYTITPNLVSGFNSSSTGNGDKTWSKGTAPVTDIPLTSAQQFTTTNVNLLASDFSVPDTATMDNIINYVVGPKANGFDVLGDIYHSDPTIVSTDTLAEPYFAVSTQIKSLNYKQFLDKIYNRPQIVIAGANDGMIHAFYAGGFTPNTAQFDKAGDYIPNGAAQFDLGTGQEVWAFIPYDILPKLQYLYNPALVPTTTTGQYWTTEGIYTTTSTGHVYYVDGSPFIRDVYLPGIDNGLGLSGNAANWHTILIIGERLGGTYYICLDITDTMHPKFMWEFTTNNMGFTFDQVAPNPAPIGPVWLNYDPSTNSTLPSAQLRYVVMFSGGWDPAVTTNRGRAFYVVDITTGKLLWKFDQTNDSTNMKYPTPASIADIAPDSPAAEWWQEALMPDLGGQVWQFSILRPGSLDGSTNLVHTCISPSTDTNCWWGQRAFAAADPPPSQNLAQQFYYIPATLYDTFAALRVGTGAGNRDNPLDCTTANYFYQFPIPDPYVPKSPVWTASNLTQITIASSASGNAAADGTGWYIALNNNSVFTGTSTGAKEITIPYPNNNTVYFSIFTPDQAACSGSGSTQFSCNVLGGTSVITAMTLWGPNAGQVLYVSSPMKGISDIFPSTSLYGSSGSSGSSGTTTTTTPTSPYTIPVCGGGAGGSSAKTQIFASTSEGAVVRLPPSISITGLMYPLMSVCLPRNVEGDLVNPANAWSTHRYK